MVLKGDLGGALANCHKSPLCLHQRVHLCSISKAMFVFAEFPAAVCLCLYLGYFNVVSGATLPCHNVALQPTCTRTLSYGNMPHVVVR